MASLLIAVIYLCFVSLGLPDSLLGAGWPQMQIALNVPSSYAGYVSMAIALMTIISALISPYLIRKIHTKWIVIVSIFLTVTGLLGFSFTAKYWTLLFIAIPYGLGAGSVDASLNNYVAVHYKSSVMNFLHCFYGAGAVISPMIMSAALKYARWNEGYRWTAYVQAGILAICILSLPLWKTETKERRENASGGAGMPETLKVPGVLLTLISFFSYCAGEATCFLWTSSYFAGTKDGISDELVAAFGSLIFGGLMIGRILSGFVSNKFSDKLLIRIGIAVEFVGIILIIVPFSGYIITAVGFLVTGVGMGPIYPAIIHMAPERFGEKYSAAVIGMEMASAYIGAMLMPMLFGHLQQALGIWILPIYQIVFAVLNIVLLELSYFQKPKESELF